jgi:RND family efflux transporter MFP subunit
VAKNRRLVIAVATVALLGGGGAFWAVQRNAIAELPAEALITVKRGDLDIVVAETGRIQPLTKVDIKAKVAGQVEDIRVKEGQTVTRGQVLLSLDPTDFKRKLAEAEADQAMIRAELDALLAGSRREDLSEARAMLSQARARDRRASEDRARAAKAMEAGSLTPREWDAARSDAAQAAAEVRAYESKLARLQAGARPEEIAQARARLRKAEVAVASARDQLAYTVIKAPISGTVIHRGIEAGEMVTPGVSETGDRKPLLTVADLSKLVVESDINQIDVGKLTLGQAVSIRVDTLPGVAFSGSVYKVAPAAVAGRERDVQLFPIQTIVSHVGADKLKPGMSADLDIFIQKRPHVLLLPVEAVVRDKRELGHVTVVKKGADGHWIKEKRSITLGTGSDHEIEVVSGLAEGEQVYIDPASAKDNVNQF